MNGTCPVVIHSYAEVGSYWVRLTVSDGELESTEQIHVTVKQQGGEEVIKIFHLLPEWAYSARNYISHYF